MERNESTNKVTFHDKDLPALIREKRRQGKEQETEVIQLLSHLRGWDSFSKEGKDI